MTRAERERLRALVDAEQRRRRHVEWLRHRSAEEPGEDARVVAEHVPYVRAHKTGRWEIR